jgi:methylmalonyl-CoA mutase N-terminal domain/subunit
VQECYGPADATAVDYDQEIGDPGRFPYTRGIHRDMFRGRFWTRREVCGIGTPEDTNRRMRYLIEEGTGGLNVITDIPHKMGIDPDHPLALQEVGVSGVSISTIEDVEELCRGIPLDKVSFSLITATPPEMVLLAEYVAVAQRRGIDPACLRGTVQNDPLHARYCGFRPSCLIDLSPKVAVDIIEYCTRHMPLWYPTTVNLYDMREQGIDAAQEIAFAFSIALVYIQGALERGLGVDEFGPRLAFYVSAHIDIFEEVAKIRAARRMWAKIMRDRFGAQDERSMRFRFAVHTAGCSLVPQQPLNNIVRVAYEALVAVMAGCQSLHCCGYDEPIALPSEEAHRIALRTQQILAYETGVASVADPLGGSYYVEALTNRVEAEAAKVMAEIEAHGGMVACMRHGWLDAEIEKAALQRQREIDTGERIIVGVNAFRSPTEEHTPGGVQRIPHDATQRMVERIRHLRETRDSERLRAAIDHLREQALQGSKVNLMPAVIEAVKAHATTAEVLGTIRVAYGHQYDPLGVLQSPFD